MVVKEFWRCSEVVSSPVRMWSEMVQMHSARLPYRAAFMYRAAASISSAMTPIFFRPYRLSSPSGTSSWSP